MLLNLHHKHIGMKYSYIISLIFFCLYLCKGDEVLPTQSAICEHIGIINGWECYQEKEKLIDETINDHHVPDDFLDGCLWVLKAKKGNTIVSLWSSAKAVFIEHKTPNSPLIMFHDPVFAPFGNILFVVRFDADEPKLLFMTPFSWDVPFYYTFVDDGSTEGDLRGTLFAKGINYVVNGKTEGVIGEFQEWLCWDLSEETISNPVSRPYPYPPHEKQ